MRTMTDVGGYQLAARVTGGLDPPLVFISGIGESLAVWEQHLHSFAAGYATVCYDRAGIGGSQPRPTNVTPRPYSALADELLALLDALGIGGQWCWSRIRSAHS